MDHEVVFSLSEYVKGFDCAPVEIKVVIEPLSNVAAQNLNDRVVLVTGAATGMGRATALLFARKGARVAVNYARSREAAEDAVAEIRKDGGAAIAVQADVADDREVRAMMARVEHELGGLDYLVNNAGWSTVIAHAQLDALTDEIWDRTFNTNLRGAFYCARAAAPLLRRRGGAIVNIASVAAQTGFGSSIAYAASKGGMITMTKSLARALAPEIRVNAIAPGAVRTRFAGWPDTMFEQAAAVSPLQRIATVDEVAEAVLFLCAGAGSITGEVLTIDSGLAQLGRTR